MKRTAVHSLLLLVLTAMLSGCTIPGGGLLNTNIQSDAGQAPTCYEQTIRDYLQISLKDPRSIIDFSVSKPILTSCAVGIYGPFHGWRVALSYNAKNSYGGYVGLKTYYCWFHGERLRGIGENPTFCPEAPGWQGAAASCTEQGGQILGQGTRI